MYTSKIVELKKQFKKINFNNTTNTCIVKDEEKKKIFESYHLTNNVNNNNNNKKFAIFAVGLPGSGKSTIINNYIKLIKKSDDKFILINTDNILENLESYKKLQLKNKMTAAGSCFKVASILTELLYYIAIEKKNNIVYDGTNTDFDWASNQLKQLYDNGYDVYICIVTIELDKSIERIKKRGNNTGRYIDSKIVKEKYDILQTVIPKYINLDFLKNISIYDNNGIKPQLLNLNKFKIKYNINNKNNNIISTKTKLKKKNKITKKVNKINKI